MGLFLDHHKALSTLSTCIQLNILKLLESSEGTFDSFDMRAINYILFCTVYFDPFDMK